MSELITVVRVAREPVGTTSFLRVYFSKPVQLRDIGKSDIWWAENDSRDELDAYLWGQDVIEKHKEMENGKKP